MVEIIDFVAHILRLHLYFCSGCVSTLFVHSRGSSTNRIMHRPSGNNTKWVNIVSRHSERSSELSTALIRGILNLGIADSYYNVLGFLPSESFAAPVRNPATRENLISE